MVNQKNVKQNKEEEELLNLKPNIETEEASEGEAKKVETKNKSPLDLQRREPVKELKGKDVRESVKQAKKILGNKYLAELTKEGEDQPEIKFNKHNLRGDRVFGDKEAFEEENYRRARLSKKKKKEMKKKFLKNRNDDLNNFKDLNDLKSIITEGGVDGGRSKKIYKRKRN